MAEPGRILVADDERHIRFFLTETLTQAGHQVTAANDGHAALECLKSDGPFDLMLLDIKMPGRDGVEVMRVAGDIAPDTITILLTGHATVESAIAALREGAHDYLLKPASSEELLSSVEEGLEKQRRAARQQQLTADLEQNVRRLRETMQDSSPATPSAEPEEKINAGPLIIDIPGHEVRLRGDAVHLTPTEFDVLTCLARSAGEVLTYEEIVTTVWDHDSERWEARSLLNPHLSHLRQKIQPDPDHHEFIVNVRGIGYRFVSPE